VIYQDGETSDEVAVTESRSMSSGDGGTLTPGSVSMASLQVKECQEIYSPNIEFNFSKFSGNQDI
jgi:hypothetical protein